jgi:cell division transport system permease protein
MISWSAGQVLALSEALARARRQPAGFAVNVLALAIVLALPFFGASLLESLRPLVGRMAVEPEISIFLSMETPRARSTVLAVEIRKTLVASGVGGELAFIPRENALTALKARSGMAEAVATLGTNPLPDAFVVKLSGLGGVAQAGRVEGLAARLKALPGVEFVQVDAAWVTRLAALADLLRDGLLALACALAVVVVVFNTIRLQILNQHDQIRVALLMGATEGYVAAPFYYGGAVLGLVAGAVAWLMVLAAWQPVSASLQAVARIYAMDVRLAPPDPVVGLALLGASTVLGLVGAMLSAGRQLRRTAAPL